MNDRTAAFGVMALCLAVSAANGAPQPKKTTITAKRASFDYKDSIAEFVGNVEVIDPEVKMKSEKLTVFFDGSNNVRSVTAVGSVRLSYQGKTATCEKAVYIAREGYIAMTGDAKIREARDTIAGNVIQIWIHDEKMTVEPGRLIIYPQEGKKTSALKVPGGRTGR